MKKFFSLVLALLMSLSLFGCSNTPKHFTGTWNYLQIISVEIAPNTSASDLDSLKEIYGADTAEGIESNAMESFSQNGVFDQFYIKFDKKSTYTYDPILEREATWVFYQTSEDEGFISFYAELDASAGNPDPQVCPEVFYNAQIDALFIVQYYMGFMVTLGLTR